MLEEGDDNLDPQPRSAMRMDGDWSEFDRVASIPPQKS